MAVMDSRLRVGTLTFATQDATPITKSFACQAKNVTVAPPQQPTAEDEEEVLCGDPLPAEGGNDSFWLLQINTVQDFDDPDSVAKFLIEQQGKPADVTWTPNPNGFQVAGEVTVWPGNIGGDVKVRLESQLEMRFTGKPTFTFPTGV